MPVEAVDWELVWIKAVGFTAGSIIKCYLVVIIIIILSGLSNVAWGRYQGNYLNQTQVPHLLSIIYSYIAAFANFAP